MTGPALHGTDAAAPADGGPHGPGLARTPRLRIVLGLARIEALLMVRSMLVLAGLLAGILAVWGWFWLNPVQPLWWWADWRIGAAQLFLAMTVLVAAQLAAGRPRRDELGAGRAVLADVPPPAIAAAPGQVGEAVAFVRRPHLPGGGTRQPGRGARELHPAFQEHDDLRADRGDVVGLMGGQHDRRVTRQA